MLDAGKYGWIADLAAVQVQDGQYGSVGDRVKKLIRLPSGSERSSLGFAVADDAGDDQARIEGFMGPLEDSIPWQTEGMSGVRRFLGRVWRLFDMPPSSTPTADVSDFSHLDRVLHQTIRKLTEDIENLKLNTAISQLMIFVNEATREMYVPVHMLDAFIRLLAPFAPHLCEELWQRLGHTESIAFAPWPTFDPAKCVADKIAVVVQINGKVRGGVSLPSGAPQREAEEAALKDPAVLRHLGNRRIKKTIFVPDRLLNIVVEQ